jgi:hypothetical protein
LKELNGSARALPTQIRICLANFTGAQMPCSFVLAVLRASAEIDDEAFGYEIVVD